MSENPYIEKVITNTIRKYNPNYGDNRICECGHTYDRHFDSYENMSPVGCKYCPCGTFVEANLILRHTPFDIYQVPNECVFVLDIVNWINKQEDKEVYTKLLVALGEEIY